MQPSLKTLRHRRTYNAFVANEAMEDYSLRYAAKSFRKWPAWLLANTALGGISFLALDAMGAMLIINYGFANTAWAIFAIAIIIFMTGLPIAYYSSKYNIDIDLLTRGAGFGYIGSTITSLIYASFTFIFFSIEAAIMAQALELCLNIPLSMGYVISSLLIIPLVFYGITFINRLQLYTLPLWIILTIIPFAFIIAEDPGTLSRWIDFSGNSSSGSSFNLLLFGSALSICFSLISQIGEQVDYLRFLPDKEDANRRSWWIAVIGAGPGWIIIGGLKMLCGAFLASLVITYRGVDIPDAIEPVHIYLNGFKHVFQDPKIAVMVTTLFVVISQIKINVTNAYAGSLAWSNFFSRLTHSHPGRVIWLIFNVFVALLLMQFGLLFTLESVLTLYSNFATAWIGAIVADLVLIKPLGISPPYIEFKRAHLYKINPVGFGAMFIASAFSVICHFGVLGVYPKAFSAGIALVLSFFIAPIIAFLTDGKYYIARDEHIFDQKYVGELVQCLICNKSYETKDMTYCPKYHENICSLCCSLDILCKDLCKKKRSENESCPPYSYALKGDSTPWYRGRQFNTFFVHYLSVAGILTAIFSISYFFFVPDEPVDSGYLSNIFINLLITVLLFSGIWVWWFSLSQENRMLAEDELDRHVLELEQEIKERKQAEENLRKSEERLKELNENLEETIKERTSELKKSYRSLRQADKMASLGILVSGIAHEINNPIGFIMLNSKLLQDAWHDIMPALETYNDSYENLYIAGMDFDYASMSIPKLLGGINEGAERISGIVHNLKNYSRQTPLNMEGTVDINKALDSALTILANSIKKATRYFNVVKDDNIAKFRGDTRSIEQVLINLIQNACQALTKSENAITIQIGSCNGHTFFSILDEGIGISPNVLENVRDPFFTTKRDQGGTGLGLSISAGIIEEHRGSMDIESVPGKGTLVILKFPAIR